MTHYSNDPSMVRVDFFKRQLDGWKWYTTEAVHWIAWDEKPIHDVFHESLNAHLGWRFVGMVAVCLAPYHEHAQPLAVVVGEV